MICGLDSKTEAAAVNATMVVLAVVLFKDADVGSAGAFLSTLASVLDKLRAARAPSVVCTS